MPEHIFMRVMYEWILSVNSSLPSVWQIEVHSNPGPVVTDPVQRDCVNVCVDADNFPLSAIWQTKQTENNISTKFS